MKNVLLLSVLTAAFSYADIYATFNVAAQQEADLAFAAGGTIQKMYAEVGQQVKKGATLAQLDNEESKVMLQLAQNDLEKAEIAAKQQNNSLKRYLKVKDILEDERYEKVYFGAKNADIAVQRAKNSVKLQKIQLANTYIKAPFDGIISAKYEEVGNTVTKMQPKKVYTLISKEKVKLVIEFDERHHNSVSVGDSFVYTPDGSKIQRVGKISKIYPTIDPKTRKMKAEVAALGLIPGLFGEGYIKEH